MALNKPAYQSSEHQNSGPAGHAVDGDTDNVYSHGTCTQTDRAPTTYLPAWWTVDLEETYHVDKIVLYNRGDCCMLLDFHNEINIQIQLLIAKLIILKIEVWYLNNTFLGENTIPVY